MIIPAARNSTIPTVSIPKHRALKVALYTTDCGETVSVPEGITRTNNATSTAQTARPARRKAA